MFFPPIAPSRQVVSILDFASPDVSVVGQCLKLIGVNVSTSWTTANTAVRWPFIAPADLTLRKLGWLNGSAAGGNTDVAIYDAANARLVATGSTLRSGNSVWQWVDTADLALVQGTMYYIAANHDATTSNHVAGFLPQQGLMLLGGVEQQAVGAVTLPNPFVPATLSVGRTIPVLAAVCTAGLA